MDVSVERRPHRLMRRSNVAERELAREASAHHWQISLMENDGRVVDQVKFLREQAIMGYGPLSSFLVSGHASSSSSSLPEEESESVMGVDTRRTRTAAISVDERICSCCGFVPEWDGRGVQAQDITSIVAATRFHSIECAKDYYAMGIEEDRRHLLDAVFQRIERAFDKATTRRSAVATTTTITDNNNDFTTSESKRGGEQPSSSSSSVQTELTCSLQEVLLISGLMMPNTSGLDGDDTNAMQF